MPLPAQSTHKIGQIMPDGTLYAGISPTTKQAMYMSPLKASMTFNAAVTGGKKDFRLPDIEELKTIFGNTKESDTLKHAFNTSGDFPAGYYWSSTELKNGMYAKALRMNDGYVELDHKSQKYPVCFIR